MTAEYSVHSNSFCIICTCWSVASRMLFYFLIIPNINIPPVYTVSVT